MTIVERILKVTGRGKKVLHPNKIEITLVLTQVFKEYSLALVNASNDVRKIKESLTSLGFKDKDIKTSHFSIKAEYESKRNLEGGFVTTLVGYRYNQNLNLKINVDNELLGKIIFMVGQTNVNPKIEIRYLVEDIESIKNELIEIAIKDGQNKASLIASAASLMLGEIINIDYSFQEDHFSSRTMEMDVAQFKSSESYDIDLTPEDIEISDSVNITYIIK